MNSTSEYLLLFRGTHWQKGLSPKELEENVGRFMAWLSGLQAQGKVKGANPLGAEGKIVSGANGHTVLDGPFAESKEAIGGYFLLAVADLDEAVAIAKQCPTLEHGLVVEVRQIAQECPSVVRAREANSELVHA
jgi:hypothetical protein